MGGPDFTQNFGGRTVLSNGNPGFQATIANGVGVIGNTNSGVGVAGNSSSGDGVIGNTNSGAGVAGYSESGTGVAGHSGAAPGQPTIPGHPGVAGASNLSFGVVGISSAADGVYGESTLDTDVSDGIGVHGKAFDGPAGRHVGVYGEGGTGVEGESKSGGNGVHGKGNIGVKGEGNGGVEGISTGSAPGVKGTSQQNDGVYGECSTRIGSGVSGVNRTLLGGFGISGTSGALPFMGAGVAGFNTNAGGLAGLFLAGQGK
jgi:hypothetical protein